MTNAWVKTVSVGGSQKMTNINGTPGGRTISLRYTSSFSMLTRRQARPLLPPKCLSISSSKQLPGVAKIPTILYVENALRNLQFMKKQVLSRLAKIWHCNFSIGKRDIAILRDKETLIFTSEHPGARKWFQQAAEEPKVFSRHFWVPQTTKCSISLATVDFFSSPGNCAQFFLIDLGGEKKLCRKQNKTKFGSLPGGFYKEVCGFIRTKDVVFISSEISSLQNI